MLSAPMSKLLHSASNRKSWHILNVSHAVIDNPILNSPFAEPSRHWELDENGIPTGTPAHGRRRSEFIVPVPPPKHKVKAKATLDLEDEYGKRHRTEYIGEIGAKVAQWRSINPADNAGCDTDLPSDSGPARPVQLTLSASGRS